MSLGLRELKVVRWSFSARLTLLHADPNKDDALLMFTNALFPDLGYRRLFAGGIVVDLLAGLERRAEMRFWAQSGGRMYISRRWWSCPAFPTEDSSSAGRVDIRQRFSLKHCMVAKY